MLCLLLLYIDLVVIGCRDFFFFRARFTVFHTNAFFLSSVSSFYLILAVPMRECLRNTRA